jgi:superkiller protein 3
MSALVKGKLKAARDAIGKKDWTAAQIAAEAVLDFEPDNYNAWALNLPLQVHGDMNTVLEMFSGVLHCLSWASMTKASK